MRMMTNEAVWQAVLAELELTLSKANFTTWFKNTALTLSENNEATIFVPNSFYKSWIEKKYHINIVKSIESVLGTPVTRIHYTIEKNPTAAAQAAADAAASFALANTPSEYFAQPQTVNMHGLNPRYTFNSFIVSKSNELAHAAAQAVAARPGTAYNPLFIYGGVGLGKTHLMQAIGHEVVRNKPGSKILYISCETFTNDFIHSIRNGLASEFKDRYRNVDVLLVDDIQFITGKEGTQEEFFHTFNALHQEDKQIVISSDRPPKAIPALEQRLQSRFEWGMIVDISFPDVETRVAILEQRCAERHITLPKDILHTIANHIQNNIRELEGALNKVIAYIEMKHVEPTVELLKTIIGSGSLSSHSPSSISPRELIRVVSEYYDVQIDDLVGKSREKRVAFPRQIIMYLLRQELKSSYPAIGAELGGRDHTTAIHAYEKIKHEVVDDEKLKADLQAIKDRLFSNAR